MKIKPMIGDYEVPGIQHIGTVEARRVVEIPVPGLEGGYHQDLGSGPVSVCIEGMLAGDDAENDFLGKVREIYNAGDPVDFVADIITATQLDKVLVTEMVLREVAGSANTFRYTVVLTQHVEPPPSAAGLGFGDLSDVTAGIAAEAAAAAAAMNVPDLISTLPDLKDPTPLLKGTLDSVSSAVQDISAVGGQLKNVFG